MPAAAGSTVIRPPCAWAIAREMRQRIKARFDHEGIEMFMAATNVRATATPPPADPDENA